MFNSFDNFEIDEIIIFVDVTLSTFNFSYMSDGISGVHWQQTLYRWVRKLPIVNHAIVYSARFDRGVKGNVLRALEPGPTRH